LHFPDQAIHVLFDGDVGRDGDRLASLTFNLLNGVAQGLRPPPAYGYAHAFPCQRHGDSTPNSGAAAGDNRYLTR
jgi:hypothetical protein